MSKDLTKWYLTGRFKNQNEEVTETVSFWTGVAETEGEVVERYEHPDDDVMLLDVFEVNKADKSEQDVSSSTTVSTDKNTTQTSDSAENDQESSSIIEA